MSSPSKICQLAATIGIIFVLSLLTHLLCPVPVGYCISAQSPLTHDLYLVFVKQQTSVLFLYSPCWLMTSIWYLSNSRHQCYFCTVPADSWPLSSICQTADISAISVQSLLTHDLYLVFVKQQTSVLFLYSPCWLMTFIKYFVNKTLTLHLSYPYWLKTDTITDNVCPPPDIKNVSVHFLFTCGINVYSLNIYQLPNIGVTIFSPKWPTFCSLYWQTLELFY